MFMYRYVYHNVVQSLGSPNTPASLGDNNNDNTVESPAEPQVTKKKPLSRDQSKDNDDTISPEPVGAVAVLPGKVLIRH